MEKILIESLKTKYTKNELLDLFFGRDTENGRVIDLSEIDVSILKLSHSKIGNLKVNYAEVDEINMVKSAIHKEGSLWDTTLQLYKTNINLSNIEEAFKRNEEFRGFDSKEEVIRNFFGFEKGDYFSDDFRDENNLINGLIDNKEYSKINHLLSLPKFEREELARQNYMNIGKIIENISVEQGFVKSILGVPNNSSFNCPHCNSRSFNLKADSTTALKESTCCKCKHKIKYRKSARNDKSINNCVVYY